MPQHGLVTEGTVPCSWCRGWGFPSERSRFPHTQSALASTKQNKSNGNAFIIMTNTRKHKNKDRVFECLMKKRKEPLSTSLERTVWKSKYSQCKTPIAFLQILVNICTCSKEKRTQLVTTCILDRVQFVDQGSGYKKFFNGSGSLLIINRYGLI